MESASKSACCSPVDADPMIPASDSSYDDEIAATTARTIAALKMALGTRLAVERPGADIQPQKRVRSTFIKYDPASGSAGRIIRLSENSSDPLDPPKFMFRRLPRRCGSPAVPVLSSPPRSPSPRDRADWKVPPCPSDWKNPRGYSIPLDKRQLASPGGRGTQDDHMACNFAMLQESLYAAEKKAREAVQMRKRMQEELGMKEKERRGQGLRRLAKEVRAKRADAEASPAAPAVEEPRELQSESKHGDSDVHGNADEQLVGSRSKPDKVLSGGAPEIREAGKRERPVELDEPANGDDPFDLDQFMSQVKKGKEH